MGMDVFGKQPISETGKYFRNNVWWWHPLWSFCECAADDLIPEDNSGHENSGWGLDACQSAQLATRLETLLECGVVRGYSEARTAALAAQPDQDCAICAGTGKRKAVPQMGAGDQPCNGCDSSGQVRPWSANYPFDEDNVREFAAFLRDCGGFEIC